MAQRTACRRSPVLRRQSGAALSGVPTTKALRRIVRAWIRAGICYGRASASTRPRRIASGSSITPAIRTHCSAARGRTSPRANATPTAVADTKRLVYNHMGAAYPEAFREADGVQWEARHGHTPSKGRARCLKSGRRSSGGWASDAAAGRRLNG